MLQVGVYSASQIINKIIFDLVTANLLFNPIAFEFLLSHDQCGADKIGYKFDGCDGSEIEHYPKRSNFPASYDDLAANRAFCDYLSNRFVKGGESV